jgi:hypothetical protein
MRIAKPILLVTTPVGVVGGLYEAYRLAGGLVFIMAAMVGVIGTAIATVVATARREEAARRASRHPSGSAAHPMGVPQCRKSSSSSSY